MKKTNDPPPVFPPAAHNHKACVKYALQRARQVCAQRGLRLTAIRSRVLELIWSSHKPSKAYDLLAQVRAEHTNAQPPTVYRALTFLQEAGLVHRIASLNAFVGCHDAKCEGDPQFLICRECDRVAEMTSHRLNCTAARAADTLGFKADHEIIELYGLCAACHENKELTDERCVDT